LAGTPMALWGGKMQTRTKECLLGTGKPEKFQEKKKKGVKKGKGNPG